MKKVILTTVISATLLLSGCEELEQICGYSSDDLGFSQDYTRHFDAATYIYQQTDRALRDPDLAVGVPKEIDGAMCTRTADSLTIDYSNGAVGADGITRSGAIKMAIFEDYLTANGAAYVSLEAYKQANISYEGGFSLTNTTTSSTPQITFAITEFATDSAALNANLTIDWMSGFTTQGNVLDDIFDISGTAVLTSKSTNNTFTGTLQTPVKIDASCPYTFVSGVIELIPSQQNLPQVSVDFIDGNCDNLFQSKIKCEGNEFSFSYPIK